MEEIIKEIFPTKEFYSNFPIYQQDKKCKHCGNIIKSKRPNVRFYLISITKSGLLRVKYSNRKTIHSFHKKFFII